MKNISTNRIPCFRRWNRKGWSAFASLHREVTIGVLSATMSILLLSAQRVAAQDADTTAIRSLRIDEVGISGSQSAPTPNALATMTLFDRKAQTAAPVQTLEAALRLTPSVDLRERGGRGAQADIAIRGGSFDQTMVLLNGIDFTDARTGHQSHSLPVDLETISAVELIDGLPGVGAYAGAVNIRTVPLYPDYLFGRQLRLRLCQSFGCRYGTAVFAARSRFLPAQRRVSAQYRFRQLQCVRKGDVGSPASGIFRVSDGVAKARVRFQRILCGL